MTYLKKIDILNLEWPASDRDANMVAPVLLALSKQGYTCVTGDIFNYLTYLAKYRPKVLLISNFSGATINHSLCELANKLGIKVVSMISEGNVRESAIEEMTWGHNVSQIAYFEKYLLWSERSQNLITKHYPNIASKLSVSGHCGMDSYSIFSFKTKESFLVDNFPELDKQPLIVGLAGWGFDMFSDTPLFKSNSESLVKSYGWEQINRFREDFEALKQLYKTVIANNPDTIFILRRHPGVVHTEYCEFEEITNLPNVYFSQPRCDKYSISDLISISDYWGGYETTTALEAWLIGRETFLVNPSGTDFIRDELYKGSFVVRTDDELETLVRSKFIFSNDERDRVIKERKALIADTIGFDDGKNYTRAAKDVSEVVMSINSHPEYCSVSLVVNNIKLLAKQTMLNIPFFAKIFNRRVRNNNQVSDLMKKYDSALNEK